MKTFRTFNKIVLAVASIAAVSLATTAGASAIAYQGDQTVASPVPAFNVYTGVPDPVGNESDFFRARAPINNDVNDSTTHYSDPLTTTCENNQVIQMRVYVHNGATKDNNNDGTGPSVAHGTKVKVSIPNTESTTQTSGATISANNAASVSDNNVINCGSKKVKISYIPGTARQYSIGSGVINLGDTIVTDGVSIQSEKIPGDVWGCWNERVYVVLSVKVEEVKPPVTPPAHVLACTIEDSKFIFDKTKRSVNVTLTTTATNATVTGYKIDWGDKTTAATTQTANHVYGSDVTKATVTGSFTVSYTGADGKPVTNQVVSGENCTKQVSFDTTPVPPPITPPVTPPVTPPTTVTALPNTGAGNIAVLFGVAVLIGTLGYRFILGRRLAQN